MATTLRWAGGVLAWSALLATTLALAYVLQALAASAFSAPGPATVSSACLAALAADGNERESFLAHVCSGAATATPPP